MYIFLYNDWYILLPIALQRSRLHQNIASRLYYNTISQQSNVKRSFSEPYEVDISMIFAHHLCFTAAYQDCAYHMPGSCKCCVPVDSVGDR